MFSLTRMNHAWKKSVANSFIVQTRLYQWKTGVYGHRNRNKEAYSEKRLSVGENENSDLYVVIDAYRTHGHKKADINPINISDENHVPDLDVINRLGLNRTKRHNFTGLINSTVKEGTLEDAQTCLESIYCGKMSAEFMYLEDFEEKEWFINQWEHIGKNSLPENKQLNLLKELLKSQVLDKFLATKFVSLKRYGNEGAEGVMGCYMEILERAASDGVSHLQMSAHHRGRLNLSTCLLNMSPQLIFRKVMGKSEFPKTCIAHGDVLSHLCPSTTLKFGENCLHVQMTNVPSHLEAVGPVSMGKTRGIQQELKESDYGDHNGYWSDKVLNVQVHGDAALMGQGVVQESVLMSTLPHFAIGGTIHIIINNQLGFTTPPQCGRGTRYASDIAKIASSLVIHVNGDYPEEVVKATRLAAQYQRKFRKNVFIDINCFRKWGHNELDDPTFTSPTLYNLINNRKSVPDKYAATLIEAGITTQKAVSSIEEEYYDYLNKCFKNVDTYEPALNETPEWRKYPRPDNAVTTWDTGVDPVLLNSIGQASVTVPADFNVHPNLQKHHVNGRLAKLREGEKLDWATAEALAIGSLLYQGFNVRMSGQDVGRGTFSHRHFMLIDQKSDDIYIPLNNLSDQQIGHLEMANSLLSEEAVLGFEYGFSSISPNNLVIWEAQFGDFFNGAQIQIDTYVTSGEAKWLSRSALVMLLPHGYDGAGSEHTSCRIERFLQLSDSSEISVDGDDVNFSFVNPTTPAQYFHLLRRQMVRNFRKPLIVAAPKIILRSPDATSSIRELQSGTEFQPVLGDQTIRNFDQVRKLIFVSGKHYYALHKKRDELNVKDVAIIRLEELSPFPTNQLRNEIKKYKNAKEFIWSQEEHRNMGPWSFCKPRFENLVGYKLKYVGRNTSPVPAVGIGEVHKVEAAYVVEAPFSKKIV